MKLLKHSALAGLLLASSTMLMMPSAKADLFKGFGGICFSKIHTGRLISGYAYQNYHVIDGWVTANIYFGDTQGNLDDYFGTTRLKRNGYIVPNSMNNIGFAFYDMYWEGSNGAWGIATGAPTNCVMNPYNSGDVFTGEQGIPILGN